MYGHFKLDELLQWLDGSDCPLIVLLNPLILTPIMNAHLQSYTSSGFFFRRITIQSPKTAVLLTGGSLADKIQLDQCKQYLLYEII